MNLRLLTAMLALAALLLPPPVGAQLLGRGQQEARTINTDRYEVVVQRNGQINLKTIAGEYLFEKARAEVRFAEEEAPQTLPVDFRRSTRLPVHDPLGEGQGLMFAFRECEWYLRAYPTKPLITIQVVYVNTGNRPVRVAELIPWSVGSGGRGGGAVVMGTQAEQTHLLEHDASGGGSRVVTGKAQSAASLAALNPVTGRGLVAGFLTHTHGRTEIRMARTDEAGADQFDRFRASTVYDPPREVPPGGRLESEVLYLGVTEPNLLLGLERYGKAAAVWNGVRDARPFMPHGIVVMGDVDDGGAGELSAQRVLAEVDAMRETLGRHGWEHATVGPGWQRAHGDWEPDPERFPGGMAALASEMKARGSRPGIWLDPFVVDADAPLAAQHPEWMGTPTEEGRALIGQGCHILDITAPGAHEYVRELVSKLTRDWGFETLVLAGTAEGAAGTGIHPLLLLERYHDARLTRVEVMRQGLRAVQEGTLQDTFLVSGGPQPIVGVFAHAVGGSQRAVSTWDEGVGDAWGAAQVLSDAARNFYRTPHQHVPWLPSLTQHGGAGLSGPQRLAWFTGAAMTGGVLSITERVSDLPPEDLEVLRRLLPVPTRAAIPVDLMQPEAPRIWHLPLQTPAGAWDILALFNWDTLSEQELTVPFDSLGLPPGRYHTVYDFWRDHYHGTAIEQLRVRVPPGSVQLLGLRPHTAQPMLLSSDSHFTQGALDHEAVDWNPATRTLSGRFAAAADTTHVLTLLVPEGYHFESASAEGAPVEARVEDNLLRLHLAAAQGGDVAWHVVFTQ